MYKKILSLVFILITTTSYSDNFSVSIENYYLSGRAKEIVYKNTAGDKLSELIWDIDDTNLLMIGTSYDFTPTFSFNGEFYFNYNTGKSQMTDSDWTSSDNSVLTHWSISPTDINQVRIFDINLKYAQEINDIFSVSLAFGYKSETFKWVAIGGDFIYPSGSGSFPNAPVISYNQYFRTFYMSSGIESRFRKLGLSLDFVIGVADSEDEDMHHLKNLYFQEFFYPGLMTTLKFRAEYNFTDNFSLSGILVYNKYFIEDGYIVETYVNSGISYTYDYGSAGIANETTLLGFGMKYKF